MTVFVTKGDEALTDAQLSKRTQKYIDIDWPQWKRERSVRLNDGLFNTYMTTVSVDTDTNRANNTFNQQLADYRVATARLAQYRLADGRDEVTEDVGTGEFDEDGNEITETVVVTTAIDPLPAQVEQPVYDDDGNQTGTAMVDNPAIVQDDEERAAAQAVIDGTSQSVVDFV
jgi:Ran GTPase-activating protein (RanGAP) involved in mRNA processing and transport